MVDPLDCLGSLVLEVLDSTILALLLDPTDLDAFGFLLYALSDGDCVITGIIMVSLRGSSLVEVILVKGHSITNFVSRKAATVRKPASIDVLAVLVTEASQSRQHESRKPPIKSLFDVGSRRISIVTVNTKEYHSDVLEIITRILHRTL
ncbi:hypothetical protein Tco_1474983 [Tanacetum coccineum]